MEKKSPAAQQPLFAKKALRMQTQASLPVKMLKLSVHPACAT
jgi:hypothetical protein